MLDLFDKNFLKTLRMLDIITRKFFKRERMGVRRTRHRGSSQEFSDYKEYDPGDDLRFLDWNIYGRLDRMFIKLFYSEESLNLYLLVDTSASMGFGSPAKLEYARRIAAAIAYVGLTRHDRVHVLLFADGLLGQPFSGTRGGHVLTLFRFLEKLTASSAGDFEKSAKEFVLRTKRPGPVFVLSDFFFDSDTQTALRLLEYHRFETTCLHLLDPLEESPRYSGLCHLVDSEDGSLRELDLDSPTLSLYRDLLGEFCRELEAGCAGMRVAYHRVPTSTPFENVILGLFRERKALAAPARAEAP
ncbi:MAG: DUF58 domain-containing protein [Candidatus Riflebacteria bacterium]|nr:DUF58 domain-containing protein [Candidatus Riflebacteria bacterium]